MSCYRTCTGCKTKDVTVSWSALIHAAVCVACRVDFMRQVEAKVEDAVNPGFRLSPAALRAIR